MSDNVLKGMVPLMGVVMMAGVLQMIIPKLAEAAEPPLPPSPPPPTGFGCPYCGLLFDTGSELITHINEMHPDMPPWVEVDIGWGEA